MATKVKQVWTVIQRSDGWVGIRKPGECMPGGKWWLCSTPEEADLIAESLELGEPVRDADEQWMEFHA
jgi:hypothetical protein